jgi:DNA (cytosine-5)-methyltransferase 1
MSALNVLSLFSGIGGLELGLERAGMRTVGQVEIDPYCQRVLAKHWPDVPRHDDVRTAADWWLSTERPTVDVICGGFPCQDISAAGRRAGIVGGERSSLWSFMADTIRRVRPKYVLVENVAAVLVRGLDGVVPLDVVAADLAEIGYDLEWDCIPASSVGARHRRDRWFGVAYACSEHGGQGRLGRSDRRSSDGEGQRTEALADAFSVAGSPRLARPVFANAEARRGVDRTKRRNRAVGGYWHVEPGVGRVVDGLPPGLVRDRLKALGNAVVPQVAEHVGRLIVAHHERAVA